MAVLLAGNDDQYALASVKPLEDSPLAGKKICFLGSSVTFGSASCQESFADFLAKRNGCTYVKEAVSGTTLVEKGEASYIERLRQISADEKFDLFICQLSTNDATQGQPLGQIAATLGSPADSSSQAAFGGAADNSGQSVSGSSDCPDAADLSVFDTGTITGAMEYIIAYVKQTWHCPVMFYTGARYDSPAYAAMVRRLMELQQKWGIGVIDLWTDEVFNRLPVDKYQFYMADPIHPTRAGYLEWWTPAMEQKIYSYLKECL